MAAMKEFQFSLRNAIAAVLAAALGLAAMIRADPLWEFVILAGTVSFLLVGLVFIVTRRGHSRFFWTGFCVAGWGYVALFFGAMMLGQRTFVRWFPITRVLMYSYEHAFGSAAGRLRPPFGEEFVFIGHFLFSLVCGFAGGYVARSLYAKYNPSTGNTKAAPGGQS